MVSLPLAAGGSFKSLGRARALFSHCSRLLSNPPAFAPMPLTNSLWPVENLDEQMVLNSEEDLKHLLNRPFVYRQRRGRIYSQGYPLTELLAVGPVVFHGIDEFSNTQKAIIQEVAREAKNPNYLKKAREKFLSSGEPPTSLDHGIEVGIWLVTLRDGSWFRLPIVTSYHPYEITDVDIQLETVLREKSIATRQILKKEFFHWHPAIRSLAASLSEKDVLMVKNMCFRDKADAKSESPPEIHIFSVSETPWGLLMGHYGQLAH